MQSVIEAQQKAALTYHDMQSQLGWNSIYNDSNELFEAKLELKNAARALKEACEAYREAHKRLREVINAGNGDN